MLRVTMEVSQYSENIESLRDGPYKEVRHRLKEVKHKVPRTLGDRITEIKKEKWYFFSNKIQTRRPMSKWLRRG